ncbi:hypothetical protein SDC9_153811 [bioreactor metagenome]|uniref:Phosphatidate cytidylyltransferase n=1 Tax=bioreactor metagenome TaxID=1076179 RepID=A0A645EX02_9ZZZZ
MNEFYSIASQKNYPIFRTWGVFVGLLPYSIYIMTPLSYSSVSLGEFGFAFAIIISIFILSIGSLLAALFSKNPNIISSIGVLFAGFLYISFSFYTLIYLRDLKFYGVENFGLILVFLMFGSIWTCDSAAYFVGRRFGKHKLMEHVSPKKTIEGAVAGFLGSVVFFIVASYYLLPHFNFVITLIPGIIIGIFGQLGDLIESKIKRDADVKDSSHIIPGHGGILDRFDSILFVSPILTVFFVLLKLYIR